MKKLLIILALTGCASVSAQEDVTVSQDFTLDVPTLPPVLMGTVRRGVTLPPVSLSQEVDVSDQLSQLNDNGIDYTITLNSDVLDCAEGFTSVNDMTLNLSNDEKNVDIVPTFALNIDTQHLKRVNLPLTNNTKDVLDILKAGKSTLTLTVTANTNGFVDGNVPTHFHNTLQLHLNISADKSL